MCRERKEDAGRSEGPRGPENDNDNDLPVEFWDRVSESERKAPEEKEELVEVPEDSPEEDSTDTEDADE